MNRLNCCRVLFAVSTLATASNCASAQPPESHNIPPRTVAPEREKFAPAAPLIAPEIGVIAVKNMPVAVLARLIDPDHNPEPLLLEQSRLNLERSGNSPFGTKHNMGIFELPEGVESAIASRQQNVLLVTGTVEGIKGVKSIVELFDRPLRQVEIEARVVEISPEDLKSLGADFTSFDIFPDGRMPVATTKKLSPSLGFVRNNYQIRLQALIDQEKVKVLQDFKFTTINNLTGGQSQAFTRPATLGTTDEKGQFQTQFVSLPDDKSDAPQLRVGNATTFFVTPTVNNDGTITVLLTPMKVLQMTVQANANTAKSVISGRDTPKTLAEETFFLRRLDGVQTVVNLRDNDTIVLGGLSPSLFSSEPVTGEAETPRQAVLFLKAHVWPQ